MSIGTELKAIMEREGITGYRLSQRTGMGQSYLSKIFHNQMNPSYLTLKRILDVLGYQICFQKISKRKEVKRK